MTAARVRQEGAWRVPPSSSLSSSPSARPRLPGWHLLALTAGVGAVAVTSGPIRDPDVFWHTLVGEYALRGRSFPHPDPFAFTLPDAHWHTTSWLSEIVLAATYDVAGLAGIVAVRMLLGLALFAVLYRLLVTGRQGWQGPVAFTVVVLPITDYVQERPQTASLLFFCWLAAVGRRYLVAGQLPRRWRFVAVTYLWAFLHGLFVFAPFCLGVLAAGALLDGGRRRLGDARHLLVTAAVTTATCALTPMGPRLLLAPFTVGSAARGRIAEWFPTQLTTLGTVGLVSVLALTVTAWARGSAVRPRSHVFYTIVLSFVGFLATRNAGPMTILLAVMAVEHATVTWPDTTTLSVPRRPALALTAVALLAALVSYVGKPVLSDAEPRRLAAYLAHQQGTVRVLNDYNVSGYLLREAWPHVALAIDGRADRYGHGFLQDYSDAVNGHDGWQEFVASLDVDLVLLNKNQPLSQLLLLSGWQTTLTDGDWLLLSPPSKP